MGAEKKKSSAKASPAKPDKTLPKPATKAVAKSAPKAAAKPTPTLKPAPASKVAKKAAVKPEAKPASKPEAKPVAKSKAKSSAATDVAVEPATHGFPSDYLVLMQKDPNWMHAFWDVNEQRLKKTLAKGAKLVLRLYDVASDLTVRTAKKKWRDIEIPVGARSWYVQNPAQSGNVKVSLGAVDSKGHFQAVMDSSQVSFFGAEGQLIGSGDNIFLRASLGGVPVDGFGSSALSGSSGMVLPAHWTSSLSPSSESLFSGSVSSSEWASQGSSATVPGVWGKDFFLWVKTRLIVYGGTRPDAHLQIRGEPFPLNPDGTFSIEMDLPDSTQIIPVFATDKDGDFPTTIVPIVIKRTET